MELPDQFPEGCQFFCTVRDIRNYVKFPDKSLYVLSFKGNELLPVKSLPACPVSVIPESSFKNSATRCQQFSALFNRPGYLAEA